MEISQEASSSVSLLTAGSAAFVVIYFLCRFLFHLMDSKAVVYQTLHCKSERKTKRARE